MPLLVDSFAKTQHITVNHILLLRSRKLFTRIPESLRQSSTTEMEETEEDKCSPMTVFNRVMLDWSNHLISSPVASLDAPLDFWTPKVHCAPPVAPVLGNQTHCSSSQPQLIPIQLTVGMSKSLQHHSWFVWSNTQQQNAGWQRQITKKLAVSKASSRGFYGHWWNTTALQESRRATPLV